MKKCPRCHKKTLHEEAALNSLSRRDNETYICNACGTEEAFIDVGRCKADSVERNFSQKVKKCKTQ